MHSVIVVLDNNHQINNWIKDKLSKFNYISTKNINELTQDSIRDSEFFILNINKESLFQLIEKIPMLKKEEFSLVIMHDKNYSFTRKDPLSRFYKEVELNESLNIENYSLWNKCHFRENKDYLLIGDVHENIEPLKSLLNSNKAESLIFLGDYLDKGNNTKETVDYMYELFKQGAKIVVGNHESYVAKRLMNEINGMGEGEQEIFTSLEYLQKNEKTANKFLEIFKNSLPFASIVSDIKVYGTHAPCHSRYFGKLSSNAQRCQRNFYFKERGIDKMREELSFLNDDLIDGLHVFGHVAHNMDSLEFNNRIWLDTGAVYGNKLSGLMVRKDGSREIVQVNSEKLSDTELFNFGSPKLKIKL